MLRELPLIELRINPEDGSFVQAVSLVENPAIEIDFISFSKQEGLQFTTNDEKMELLGAAMVPNQNIFRSSKEYGDYFCTFSADTIRSIAQNYAQKGLFNSTNIEHSIIPADSYIFQSYITDSEKGITAPKGINVPDGSWIIGMKVQNNSVWKNIKNGSIKGFSVEGIFNMIDTKTTHKYSKDLLSELDAALAELEELEKLQINLTS